MRSVRRWLRPGAVVAAAAVAACPSPPRPPAPTVLPSARDTVTLPQATATRAVPLGGDRWAVLAANDGVVAIADFAARSIGRIGGDRDTTLRNPATMFLADDTLYIGDWGRRRVTLWTPDGHLARTIDAATMIHGALPRARDAAGRFYVELAPPIAPPTKSSADSGAVIRADAASERGDTIARLTPFDVAEVIDQQGRRFARQIFSGTDGWGVLPDGSLWVARVRNNRVDWRAPDGAWTRGQALPDRVLEVTRYDREMFVRQFPTEMRTVIEQLPFAPLKPPFEDALATPEGMVWLVKSRFRTDSAGRVHVVDRRGQLQRDLRVPGRGRLIGASANAAIVAERTPAGTRLLRFALPPFDSEARRAQ